MAGNLLWQNTYGGSGQDAIQSVLPLENGRVAFAAWTNTYNNGDVSGSHLSDEIWFAKLDILNNVSPIEDVNNIKIFPLPFTDNFTIQTPTSLRISNPGTAFSLFDILGSQIPMSTQVNESNIQVKVNKELASGIYFIKIESDKVHYVGRLVKL